MERPNFVIICTDDQGYGDLSCLGGTDVRTPSLDQLAASGARLTDWYANGPVCSPTRASLLTGQYPQRIGVSDFLPGHREAPGLPPQVPTIATALKQSGYDCYFSGKWHLGVTEGSRPHHHGFDRWFGFLAGCVDYFSHIYYWGTNKPGPGINPTHDLWEDSHEVWHDGRYLTELITGKSLEYVREAANRNTPFFLYLAYNAPHYPMHAPRRYLDRFADLPWDRRVMAAMLSAVDDGVGEVLRELDRLGLRDNTCIVFTSDNGPSRESRNWLDGTLDPYYGGSTAQLRGHKGSLFEGGIRVPGIVSWPYRIPRGQVVNEPFMTMDVFPTFLNAAGAEPYACDGVDMLPFLSTGVPPPQRDLFWKYGSQSAVRRGRWKLVHDGRPDPKDQPLNDDAVGAVHLADLSIDLAEHHNVAGDNGELVATLESAVDAWHVKSTISPVGKGGIGMEGANR